MLRSRPRIIRLTFLKIISRLSLISSPSPSAESPGTSATQTCAPWCGASCGIRAAGSGCFWRPKDPGSARRTAPNMQESDQAFSSVFLPLFTPYAVPGCGVFYAASRGWLIKKPSILSYVLRDIPAPGTCKNLYNNCCDMPRSLATAVTDDLSAISLNRRFACSVFVSMCDQYKIRCDKSIGGVGIFLQKYFKKMFDTDTKTCIVFSTRRTGSQGAGQGQRAAGRDKRSLRIGRCAPIASGHRVSPQTDRHIMRGFTLLASWRSRRVLTCSRDDRETKRAVRPCAAGSAEPGTPLLGSEF